MYRMQGKGPAVTEAMQAFRTWVRPLRGASGGPG